MGLTWLYLRQILDERIVHIKLQMSGNSLRSEPDLRVLLVKDAGQVL